MSVSLYELLQRLGPDEARGQRPFGPDFADATRTLLSGQSDREVSGNLRSWIHARQPCLFGRMASAKPDLLTICVLSERDLIQPDSVIREKIQNHRLDWRRRAYRGAKSGFVILAACDQLVDAAPDENLLRFASHLAELYLLEEVVPDREYHDRLQLEVDADHVREWVVGVNFFGVQGDGRWWHDHRVPGGIAFSMNSVGHLIRSGAEAQRATELAAALESSPTRQPVTEHGVALRYAMHSIQRAHNTTSGPATCLRSAQGLDPSRCPIHPVPESLSGWDWTTYLGWYDTDHALPSIYFRPDFERPSDAAQLELELTYLFDEDDIDYFRTGPGVRTR